jgi:hypothetical protein
VHISTIILKILSCLGHEFISPFGNHLNSVQIIYIGPLLFRFLINLLISDRGWDTEVATAVLNESLVRQVSWFLSPRKRKDMREARDRDRDRGGPLPDASAAAALHSLSSDYDNSKKGYNSHNGGAQDDDCNSVLSSSNMHENRHPLSPCASNSPFGHHDQDSNTVRGSSSAHHFSHTELAPLETTAVCPYRLVTTFEVRNTHGGRQTSSVS